MYLSMFAIDLFLYGCRIHYVVFFLCFGKSRLEMLVLHCKCPAETDRDRQSTDKDRRISLEQDKTHSLRERGHPV